MKKICYITVILFSIALTLSSCNIGSKSEQISISIEDVTDIVTPFDDEVESGDLGTVMSILKEPLPMNLTVKVESSYRKDIELSDAAFSISNKNGKEILNATFTNRIVIPKKSVSEVPVDMVVQLTSLSRLASLAMMSGNTKKMIDKLYITGSFTARAGLLKKRYSIQMMPLETFMEHFFELDEDAPSELPLEQFFGAED